MCSTGATTDPDRARALRRWKEGHQAFHIFLVSINTVLADADVAVTARNQPALLVCLRRLAVLYDATTATMQYAADFPPERYADTVRPSMEPPFLSPGFSGILNTEHRLMVAGLKRLRRRLDSAYGRSIGSWPGSIAGAWAEVQRAKLENLRRHRLICARFVPEDASLLRRYITR